MYTVCNHSICRDGTPLMLRGVSLPSLEWSKSGEFDDAEIDAVIGLHVSVVRLPVNEVFYTDPGYQQTVDHVISRFRERGIVVVIDLHFVQGASGTKPDRKEMSDSQSIAFWKTAAARYAGDSGVFFELYNEPQMVSADVWLHGGRIDAGYDASGMQQLYDAVRGTGASNIVIVNGVVWGFDHSGLPRINGTNIVYGSHIYPYDGKKTAADWQHAFGFLTDSEAVMISEFGDDKQCDGTFYTGVIAFAEQHHIPWIAWAYYKTDTCTFPSLVSANGTPTAAGTVVFAALSSAADK